MRNVDKISSLPSKKDCRPKVTKSQSRGSTTGRDTEMGQNKLFSSTYLSLDEEGKDNNSRVRASCRIFAPGNFATKGNGSSGTLTKPYLGCRRRQNPPSSSQLTATAKRSVSCSTARPEPGMVGQSMCNWCSSTLGRLLAIVFEYRGPWEVRIAASA